MMTDEIVIQKLSTVEELRYMQEVEESVWCMPPTPVHQTYTALNNGGITLGAFAGDKMVGFLHSFPGFDGQHVYVCSHMLGILPDYRTGGLGVQMKLKQKELAQKMGYRTITWTFDPLESLNAYLNLHKLGAIGARYKENHYGSMDDGFNQGLETDRIQIIWEINKRQTNDSFVYNEDKVLLHMSSDGKSMITDAFKSDYHEKSSEWFVAVPSNFQEIKQKDIQLAKKWREDTRNVFQTLFSDGYHAEDIIRDHANQLSYYVFTK